MAFKQDNCKTQKAAAALLKTVAVLFFWLAVWALAAFLLDKEIVLPTPAVVAQRFLELIVTAHFWRITFMSLLRILAGFLLGSIAGIVLALLTQRFCLLSALISPVIKAVRATPVVSFIILALFWIKSPLLPIFIAFLMVLPVFWANTVFGIKNVDGELLQMAAVFKISKSQILQKIYLPSLLPSLLAAATTGLGLAWKSGIAAEVIASPLWGIGSELQAAKVYLAAADTFCWTIVVIILSLLLEKLLVRLMQRGKARYRV